MQRLRIFALLLLLSAGTSQAANHGRVLPPLAPGSFPVACSNLAHDESRLAQLGGRVTDYWEGVPDGGTGRYVTQLLAEPSAALQFDMCIPDDRSLYELFADESLPVVLLVCYPTALTNTRPDYLLPDGRWIPRMERTGDLPIFPLGNARLPLIVHSHGLGGSPVSEDYLSTMQILASNGYIVMAPFHGDARVTRIRIEDLRDLFYLAANFGRYVELQALRPLALKRALDYLLSRPGFAGRIEATQIGGFGASLGGEAMLLAMGARLTQSHSTLSSRPVEQDSRIKAAAGYAPYIGQSFLPAFGNDQHGTAEVTRPFLALSGTFDTTAPIALAEQAVNRLRGSRYLVALANVPHDYQPSYSDDVFTWVITFLNAHVRNDPAALSRLVQMGSVRGGLLDSVRIDYTSPLPLQADQVMVSEFYNLNTGHFLNAIGSGEVDFVASYAQQGWVATGQRFKAWSATASFSGAPVCRFYRLNTGALMAGQDSLFLTTDQFICQIGKRMTNEWIDLGSPIRLTPASSGQCPENSIAIRRAYNNQAFAVNHRFTTSNSSSEQLGREGWRQEGVEMCAPL